MVRVFPRINLERCHFELKDAYKAIKCLEESMANIPDEIRMPITRFKAQST
jgi:hypothetical protein